MGLSAAALAGWKAKFLAEAEGRSSAGQRPVSSHPTQVPSPSDNASNVTSAAVLTAAIRHFAEKGFAGARIDEIAAAAGVNKTALYYHFGNKDDLFAAALEYGYVEFRILERDRPVTGKSVIDQLEQLFGAVFDGLQANRLHASLIADENRHNGKHLSPALRVRIRALIEPVIRDLDGLIERGKAEGVVKENVDVTRTYLSMISLSMFYLTHSTTLSVSVGLNLSEASEILRWREHVIALLVAALTPAKGQRVSTGTGVDVAATVGGRMRTRVRASSQGKPERD